eukprot:snap_masked-scaffold_37-processed-gene-2.45-mRNA-1 protein AED:0.37 eAED:0.41 QI:0/-1/0/1/-1/1/1/0/427
MFFLLPLQSSYLPSSISLPENIPLETVTNHPNVPPQEEKFLYFEPDEGGWNNLRLGFEANLATAFSLNRTLILPPKARVYLLNKGGKIYSFDDIFNIERLRKYMKIITVEEFLLTYKEKNLTKPNGNLLHKAKKGRGRLARSEVGSYFEGISFVPRWNPSEQFLELKSYRNFSPKEERTNEKRYRSYLKRHRKGIVVDEEINKHKVIYFPQCRGENCRMLIQFYSFIYFQDKEKDRELKKLIRDNLFYNDVIIGTAKKIVDKIQKESTKFISAHIRHNDFQYKHAKSTSIDEIKSIILENLPSNLRGGKKILYIATDESHKSFFDPLKQNFKLYFLTDFQDYLKDVDPNFYGMIEQVVASKGDVFIGSWWSTFTAYIDRMRGYNGLEDVSLFYPKTYANEMKKWATPVGLGWWREWPVAWRYENEPL